MAATKITAKALAYAMRIMKVTQTPSGRVEAQGLIAQAYAAGERKRRPTKPPKFKGYRGWNPTSGELRQRQEWDRAHPDTPWWKK